MASQVESIKWVPGTEFIVDGFAFKNPRCRHYFLTHFHSDHTVGLSKGFDAGVIYASPTTARLLIHDMGVQPKVVRPLEVGVPVLIEGVRVTPLDANHCPGSVMFLFEVPTKQQHHPHQRQAKGLPRDPALDGPRSHSAAPAGRDGDDPALPAASRSCAIGGADERSACGVGIPQLSQSCREGGGEKDSAAAAGSTGEAAGGLILEGQEVGCPAVVGVAGGGGATVTTTHNILHTGDCRWQPWMAHQPGLAGVRVDTLFLDTTYAAPKHTLPPQEEAIDMMVQAMRDALAEEPATVFVVAAYHIGKERAFLGAAKQLGAKVWCNASKRALLRLLDLPPELMELLVQEPGEAAVHVTGWGLRPEDLQAYLDRHPGMWKRAVGIRPTGWTLRRSGGVSIRREGNVAIVGVPYSEHSSWSDLCEAVAQLRPRRLVPTVNAATPEARRALVDRFARLMDLSGDRSRLDVYLSRCSQGPRGAWPTPPSSGPAALPATPLSPQPSPSQQALDCSSGAGGGGPCRVDLATVDLVEQARILAALEQQHRLRVLGSASGSGRGGKRKAQQAADGGGGAGRAAKRRPKALEAAPSARSLEGCGGGAPASGGPRVASEPPARCANGGGTAATHSGGSAGRIKSNSSSSSCGAACFVDLTLGDDEDEDEGDDNEGCEAKEPGPADSLGSKGGLRGRVLAGAAVKPVRGLAARLASQAAGACQSQAAAAAGLQSSIRQFFAPARQIAAAING